MTLLQLSVKWFNERDLNKSKHLDAEKLRRRFQSNMDKLKGKRPDLGYPVNNKIEEK
jgi:hypothetical protein